MLFFDLSAGNQNPLPSSSAFDPDKPDSDSDSDGRDPDSASPDPDSASPDPDLDKPDSGHCPKNLSMLQYPPHFPGTCHLGSLLPRGA